VRAYLTLAEAAPTSTAGDYLNKAAKQVEDDPGPFRRDEPWLVFRLIQLGARAGLTKETDVGRLVLPSEGTPRPNVVADPAIRGRCQLELWRARLAASTQKMDEDQLKQCVEEKSPAFPVAMEWLARHNARVSGDTAPDRWEDKNLQPLGRVGVALGLQDGGR
jgi:hypothetical protein